VHKGRNIIERLDSSPQFVRQTEADHGKHFREPFVDRTLDQREAPEGIAYGPAQRLGAPCFAKFLWPR
jgi:hypothetical protein